MKNADNVYISELSKYFSQLYSEMGKGYLLIDELGQPIDANDYFLTHYAIKRTEGSDFLDVLLDDDSNKQFYSQVLINKISRQRIFGKDRFIEEGFPYHYANGTYGVISLTQTGAADLSSFIQDEWNRRIFSLIPNTVIITDHSGHILYISPQFYKLYGEAFSSEFQGQFIGNFFGDDFRKKFAQILADIKQNKEVKNQPVQIARKNGRILDGELTGFSIIDDQGDSSGIVFILNDVTEQVRIKEILLEEALLNASVARLSQTILQNDSSLNKFSHLFLEEVFLLSGCSGGFISEGDPASGDIIFHAISSELAASDKVREKDGSYRIPVTSSIYNEFMMISKDYADGFFTNSPDADSPLQFFFDNKDLRLYNYMMIPLEYQDMAIGQLLIYSDRGKHLNEKIFQTVKRLGSIYVLSVLKFRRQSEVETAKDLAESANKEKNRLFSAMSIELRNPLDKLGNYIDELMKAKGRNKTQILGNELQWIREELIDITTNVMEIAQIESRIFNLASDGFDLLNTARNAVHEGKSKAVHRNIKVEMVFPDDLSHAYRGDGKRIKQILLNIINYCVKYTKDDIVSLFFKERRRFNNTSEIVVRIELGKGRIPRQLFEAVTDVKYPDPLESEIELIVTKKILNKIRGSLSFRADKTGIQHIEITLPLFRDENFHKEKLK